MTGVAQRSSCSLGDEVIPGLERGRQSIRRGHFVGVTGQRTDGEVTDVGTIRYQASQVWDGSDIVEFRECLRGFPR